MPSEQELTATGDLLGLARSGAMPSLVNLAQVPPNAPDLRRAHYLGTDSQGRDVLARLLYGFRLSVLFGLILTILSSVIGIAAGAVKG